MSLLVLVFKTEHLRIYAVAFLKNIKPLRLNDLKLIQKKFSNSEHLFQSLVYDMVSVFWSHSVC